MPQPDDWLERKALEMAQGERKLSQTMAMLGISENDRPEAVGLRVLPDGPSFLFPAIRSRIPRERLLSLGTHKQCDLRMEADSTVSRFHCLLIRRKSLYVIDCESRNGTYVDGVRHAFARLQPGQILRVGGTELLVLGSAIPDRQILASTLGEFLRKAIRIYGNPHRAAEALRMPYTTLRGWLQNGRFSMVSTSQRKAAIPAKQKRCQRKQSTP